MALNKNYLIPIFLIITLHSILSVFHSSLTFDWTFQDWMINYEGGFVRRGLSGEVITTISNFFFYEKKQFYHGIQIHLVYFYIVSIFCFFYYLFLYLFFKNEKLNLEKLFIILSPLSLPFLIYNPGAAGRKEILLFILFISFVYFIKYLKKKELLLITTTILFVPLFLIHEGLIFFISSFLILYILEIKPENKKIVIPIVLFAILLSITIFVLSVIFKGNSYQVEQICSSLSSYSIKDCSGLSAIGMLSDTHTLSSEFEVLWTRAFTDGYIFYYPIFASISFFALIKYSSRYYFNVSINDKIYSFNFIVIAIIYFLNSLPLYIFTHDWGRWLNISYILLMITFFHLKKVNKIYLKNTEVLKTNQSDYNIFKKIFFFVVLIFYGFGINVSYFGGYTNWIRNYLMIDDQLRFGMNVLKTFTYFF